MNKYQLLDDAICDFFSAGMRGSPCINDKLLLLAADALSTPAALAHIDQRCWRLIDRRMQAMRKAGRTKYLRARKGFPAHWEVVASNEHDAAEHAILP